MTTKSKIRAALKELYGAGAGNAYQIFKGYDASTGRSGWHIVPFGGTARWIGDSEREALAALEEVAEYQEEQARGL